MYSVPFPGYCCAGPPLPHGTQCEGLIGYRGIHEKVFSSSQNSKFVKINSVLVHQRIGVPCHLQMNCHPPNRQITSSQLHDDDPTLKAMMSEDRDKGWPYLLLAFHDSDELAVCIVSAYIYVLSVIIISPIR